jgi:hypothetical protein
MPTQEVILRCHNCGYENEHQRVYCHSCGTKLDRSTLPSELTARKNTSKVEQRIRKLTNPRRGKVLAEFKALGISILSAAVLAFLIVVFLPPDDAPTPLNSMELSAAPTIYDDLTNASSQPVSRRIAYSEVGANAYLQSAYRARDIDFYMIPLRFERAYTKFNEGNVEIVGQVSLLGLSLYAGGTYEVNLKSGKLERTCVSGRLGRLQIPGIVMNAVDGALGPLWKLLDRDRRIIQQMQAVTFRKGVVEFQTRG